MEEKSKSLGGVRKKAIPDHAASIRKRQLNSRVRLSPLDFMRLIEEPSSSTATGDNFLARDLARTFKRLDRLERLAARKGLVLAPRRVHVPNLSKLEALDRELREFPTRRRLLTIKQFGTFTGAIRRLRRSVAGLTGQVRKYEHRARQAAYLARIGRLFLDAPDEVLERFILSRQNAVGENMHAVALALKRSVMLPPGQLAEWGRKGAQARWGKREVATANVEPIASPIESSVTQAPATSAPG